MRARDFTDSLKVVVAVIFLGAFGVGVALGWIRGIEFMIHNLSLWWVKLVAAVAVSIFGLLAFRFRFMHRAAYGVVEIAFATTGGLFTLETSAATNASAVTAFIFFVYVASSGFDNVTHNRIGLRTSFFGESSGGDDRVDDLIAIRVQLERLTNEMAALKASTTETVRARESARID